MGCPVSEWANRANVVEVQVNMHEAKSSLSKLVERVLDGEDVVIARAGKPVARLVPYVHEDLDDEAYLDTLPIKHPFGLHKGQIWMSDDIWDPDPELEAALDKKFGPWPPPETPE